MKTALDPAKYITELNINGMDGRILHFPAIRHKQREILLIYGHHALLERWFGLVENFASYGNVTMPDLPGFGGMDSFYTIGHEPTIDHMADYLAAFVKMRYKRKRFTIVGISFGFVVATRMLQKYPELAKKVDLVVSLVGFMHKDDFLFPPKKRKLYARVTKLFSLPPVAFLIRYVGLNGFVIKQIYIRLPAGKRRFLEMDPRAFGLMMDFEVKLWQANDVRTHWATTSEFLELDNCQVRIPLPIVHVASKGDHYFDNYVVEQHMRVVFNTYDQAVMNSKAHTPGILGDKKEMAIMVPAKLRKHLANPGRHV
jgi:pimeloyl-ACP methyl ester carboxylesterase